MGSLAARLRGDVRQTGNELVRSLEGDERLDSNQRLRALLAALDELDTAAMQVPQRARPDAGAALAAPGFGPLRIRVDGVASRFDEFRIGLPVQPAEQEV